MSLLRRLDRRYLMIVMLILLIIPAVNPIGIPIPVSSYTQEVYDYVEDLPAGSMVVVLPGVGVALWPDQESFCQAIFHHLASRPLRWVVVHFGADSPLLSKAALEVIDIPGNFPEKKYGVDYAFLGFMVGGEVGFASFCTDVHGNFAKDYYGTPIADLPVMQYLKDHNDIDVLIHLTGGDAEAPVRVFVTTFGIPYISSPTTGWVPTYMPYYNAGQLTGLVQGLIGGAEYELLIRRPSSGLRTTDCLSLTFGFTIVLIIAGNLDYHLSGKPEKTEEK
jgi:hypothetical protein